MKETGHMMGKDKVERGRKTRQARTTGMRGLSKAVAQLHVLSSILCLLKYQRCA